MAFGITYATFIIFLLTLVVNVFLFKDDREYNRNINFVCPKSEIVISNSSEFKKWIAESGTLPNTAEEYKKKCADFEKKMLADKVEFLNAQAKKTLN